MKFSAAVVLFGVVGFVTSDIATPSADGNRDTGYFSIAKPYGYTLERLSLHGVNNEIVTQPVLHLSSVQDQSTVERLVLSFHGKRRDSWAAATWLKNAYTRAEQLGVIKGGVNIVVPSFLAEVDRATGAANEHDITFGQTTWASGHKAVAPPAAAKISSYTVFDAIMDQYLDRSLFPNLKAVVVVGHSLGGQAVHRYSALTKSRAEEDRIHFTLGNPGSLLWLSTDRPHPELTVGCTDFDNYKFGIGGKLPSYDLSNINNLGRDGIVSRYNSRNIHHLFGLDDYDTGDIRCEAQVQGATHLGRGQNFEKRYREFGFGDGTNTTFNYVPHVPHDGARMWKSDDGIAKIFTIE